MKNQLNISGNKITHLLWLLTTVFCFRVVMQPLSLVTESNWLPDFEEWHSNITPYFVLLTVQITIIIVMVLVNKAHQKGSIVPNPKLGNILIVIGSIYILVMVGRLLLGITLTDPSRWISNKLSPWFHLVLATYLLIIAQYHLVNNQSKFVVFLKEKALPRLAYPVVLIFTLIAHIYMQENGIPLLISTYVPVIAAAILITLLEIFSPHNKQWIPDKNDITNDSLFMIIVQVVVPRLLTFLAVLLIIEPLNNLELPFSSLWPHQWTLLSQVVLLFVVIEFFRYWLHRAAHNIPLLWRLHAVHHSPEKLYWLNVGRFHPFEKGLQFLLDVFPFMLIGLNKDVIAIYFILYAVNGFFQHSNIKLRYGFLNYIVSSAELHRWHHSRNPDESNTNYGNNLIIWDLIFGTWFLPKAEENKDVGLINCKYPKSFISQMFTPFVAEITNRDIPMMSAQQICTKLLLYIVTRITRHHTWRSLQNACDKPYQTQSLTLNKIISKNRETKYSNESGLKNVNNIEEFRKCIPIQEYDALFPYINEQIKSGSKEITSEKPIFYAVTSGTTGSAKFLPVTKSSLKQYKEAQQLIVFHQFRQCSEAFSGRFLGIVSPSEEGQFDNGMPYGAVSGFAYSTMPGLVRSNYILPTEVFEIKNYDEKYRLMLQLALAETNITYIATANPSSLIRIMDIFNASPVNFINDLEEGIFTGLNQLPEHIQNSVKPLLIPNKSRAKEIRSLLKKKSVLTYADLWPNLRMITTWTGGSCGLVIKQLKNQLPEQTLVHELGYISSEFRGTIPISADINAGIPTLTHHFYEFIEKHKWENGEQETLLLNQLEDNKEYYIIVTTSSGLYRYFMNDIVRVRGFFRCTPLLEFIQKGRGITNMTGEKLYEGQVATAISKLEDTYQFNINFYIMIADENQSRYKLYIETVKNEILPFNEISKLIDKILSDSNIEYSCKRKSGRLAKPTIYHLISGAGEAYKQDMLDKGIREGQYKPTPLQYLKDLDFQIDKYLRSEYQ